MRPSRRTSLSKPLSRTALASRMARPRRIAQEDWQAKRAERTALSFTSREARGRGPRKPSFVRFDIRRAAEKGRKAEFRPIRHIAGLPDAAFHVKARQTWPLSPPSAAPLCHTGQNSAFGQGGGTKHPTPSHSGDDAGRSGTKHPAPSHVAGGGWGWPPRPSGKMPASPRTFRQIICVRALPCGPLGLINGKLSAICWF